MALNEKQNEMRREMDASLSLRLTRKEQNNYVLRWLGNLRVTHFWITNSSLLSFVKKKSEKTIEDEVHV